MGNKRMISTSKIRKIRATKKNRMEKGSRAENLGVNPHSNGLNFSRSSLIFFLRSIPSASSKKEIKKIIKKTKKKIMAKRVD